MCSLRGKCSGMRECGAGVGGRVDSALLCCGGILAGGGDCYYSGHWRVVPYRESAWGQPDIFGADAGVYAASAQDAVAADCDEQLYFAGCIVFGRYACAGVFRDFAAGGPGRRRADRDFDRMVAAEGERGGRPGEGAPRHGCAGYFSSRVLSADAAADGGPGIDFRSDYARSECAAALAAKSAGDSWRAHWFLANRGERIFVLRIRGPAGETAWCYGDERDHAAVVVFVGVHWGADFVEWGQRVVGVVEEVKNHCWYFIAREIEINRRSTGKIPCATRRLA